MSTIFRPDGRHGRAAAHWLREPLSRFVRFAQVHNIALICLHALSDIQPLGTVPVPGIGEILSTSTYNTDVADQYGSKSNIQSGTSNFIYLRGATNQVCVLIHLRCLPVPKSVPQATHVEFSLYAIPNSLLITPEMYGPWGITELDINNNPVLAIRELIADTPGVYTVDTPFNWLNPPPVKQVNPNSDHYCLIAEYRLWDADPINKDLWPHQKGLPTGADLTLWILSNPAIAWRNVSWTSNPSAPSEVWQVNCAIPGEWRVRVGRCERTNRDWWCRQLESDRHGLPCHHLQQHADRRLHVVHLHKDRHVPCT